MTSEYFYHPHHFSKIEPIIYRIDNEDEVYFYSLGLSDRWIRSNMSIQEVKFKQFTEWLSEEEANSMIMMKELTSE